MFLHIIARLYVRRVDQPPVSTSMLTTHVYTCSSAAGLQQLHTHSNLHVHVHVHTWMDCNLVMRIVLVTSANHRVYQTMYNLQILPHPCRTQIHGRISTGSYLLLPDPSQLLHVRIVCYNLANQYRIEKTFPTLITDPHIP